MRNYDEFSYFFKNLQMIVTYIYLLSEKGAGSGCKNNNFGSGSSRLNHYGFGALPEHGAEMTGQLLLLQRQADPGPAVPELSPAHTPLSPAHIFNTGSVTDPHQGF